MAGWLISRRLFLWRLRKLICLKFHQLAHCVYGNFGIAADMLYLH